MVADTTSAADAALRRADGGDVDGAIVALREHVAAVDDDDEAWLTLGTLLGRKKQWKDACEAFAAAVDLDGDALLSRVSYARALEEEGKLDDAVFQLLRAAKMAPDQPRILRELGGLFYKKGLYDKALQWLLKARAAAHADPPEEARAAYAIGLAQEARRDPGAAIAAYRDAIRLDPKNRDAKKTLADALASIGEHAQAVAALDDLLAVDPTNEQAAINKEVLERALHEMRERRLLGKDAAAFEASALVQAGQLKRRGRTLFGRGPRDESRPKYASSLAEVHLSLGDDGHVREALLVLPDPAKASQKRDNAFQVTVLADNGNRQPASYATAVSLTFLRELMGVPMTQAGELYAQLLAGQAQVEYAGVVARFATREGTSSDRPVHGLLVAPKGS
jgi:tetratricopeptide (TPR) repeat protein